MAAAAAHGIFNKESEEEETASKSHFKLLLLRGFLRQREG